MIAVIDTQALAPGAEWQRRRFFTAPFAYITRIIRGGSEVSAKSSSAPPGNGTFTRREALRGTAAAGAGALVREPPAPAAPVLIGLPSQYLGSFGELMKIYGYLSGDERLHFTGTGDERDMIDKIPALCATLEAMRRELGDEHPNVREMLEREKTLLGQLAGGDKNHHVTRFPQAAIALADPEKYPLYEHIRALRNKIWYFVGRDFDVVAEFHRAVGLGIETTEDYTLEAVERFVKPEMKKLLRRSRRRLNKEGVPMAPNRALGVYLSAVREFLLHRRYPETDTFIDYFGMGVSNFGGNYPTNGPEALLDHWEGTYRLAWFGKLQGELQTEVIRRFGRPYAGDVYGGHLEGPVETGVLSVKEAIGQLRNEMNRAARWKIFEDDIREIVEQRREAGLIPRNWTYWDFLERYKDRQDDSDPPSRSQFHKELDERFPPETIEAEKSAPEGQATSSGSREAPQRRAVRRPKPQPTPLQKLSRNLAKAALWTPLTFVLKIDGRGDLFAVGWRGNFHRRLRPNQVEELANEWWVDGLRAGALYVLEFPQGLSASFVQMWLEDESWRHGTPDSRGQINFKIPSPRLLPAAA